MSTKQEWVCRFVGAASGLLLMAPNLYPALSPLQAVALIPVLYLGAGGRVGLRGMLVAGVYMGLGYTLPQFFVLRLPFLMTLILTVHLTVLMVIFAWVSVWLLRRPGLAGAFAVGAFLVLLDWVNVTAVGFWGTAQSFVRCWSRYPWLIGFVCVTGITGIIFVLGTLQALAVKMILCPKLRQRAFAGIVIVFLVFVGADVAVRRRQPVAKLKVAAVGWISADSEVYDSASPQQDSDILFAESAAKAANAGARLIVAPEMGFYYGAGGWEKWLEGFASIAREHNVFLAIGYFNFAERENRLLFMNPQGRVLSEYTKTHLTVFEDFRRGDGQLVAIDVDGVRTGGMICQDDNFTRLSRGYGRKPTAVVAVPTLDWLRVKDAHLQSSIYRAIESRYGIVRAAMNGISAIVSPTGEVLACMDHFADGAGVITAEVPVYADKTIFSIYGHWPVVPSIVFLLIYIAWHLRQHHFSEKAAIIKGGTADE